GTSGPPSRRSCPLICHIPLPDNSRQEASTARASTADQDRIGLEPGFKALNLLDVIQLASPAAKDGALRPADTLRPKHEPAPDARTGPPQTDRWRPNPTHAAMNAFPRTLPVCVGVAAATTRSRSPCSTNSRQSR